MTQSLYSPTWYRVAALRPRLRSHAQIHRHVYRGQVWYVLEDRATGRFHRFTPAAHLFIGLLDGQRSVEQVWQSAWEELGDDAPSQDEAIRLLAQLHAADILLSGVPPDEAELTARQRRTRLALFAGHWRNPLAARFPLLDPERFLQRTLPLVRPLFSVWGLLLWIAVVGAALVQAAIHWDPLTRDVTDRLLAGENLLLLWLTFPLLKALHEFGHAYAARTWGGEVHEMGIMLLVLVPVPYVDASSASAFPEKHKRIVVGAAGILVETFVAALAMFVWINAEPGILRALAYNVMFIAGVSTVLFNGNPLLRYDGYYIFMDLIEIPNLATRANAYLGHLFKRYLFGMQESRSPARARGEAAWFVVYGIAAFVYRAMVVFLIAMFIGAKYFMAGVVLALWALGSTILLPVFKGIAFVLTGNALIRHRRRAVASASALLLGLLACLVWLPVPYRSVSQGVVWAPENARVLAGVDGFVGEVLATPGEPVRAGATLLRLQDPVLAANVILLAARRAEVATRYQATLPEYRVQSASLREELRLADERLADARAREDLLLLRAPEDGLFLLADSAGDLAGRFIRRGDTVGWVARDSRLTTRVVIPQSQVDLVRDRTGAVELRLAGSRALTRPARIEREVPAASGELPSRALSLEGGGTIAADMRETGTPTALLPIFQFDVSTATAGGPLRLGERAYVRFDHGAEPLVYRIYRALRRAFLRHFDV